MIGTTKFSILVVTLNAETGIEETLLSIKNQSYGNYEVIIKDGKSTDNTLMYIPDEDRFKVYIEKDESVYDGMNQAMEYIQGDYAIFLNAGDAFFDDRVLERVDKFIQEKNIIQPCVLYGDYSRGKNSVQYQKRKLNSFFLYRKPLCHQSILYHKSILQKNKYNLNYKISADHELTLRLWKSGVPFIHTEQVICQYIGGGMSETPEGKKLAVMEKREAILKYYSKTEVIIYDLIMKMSFVKVREWILSSNSPNVFRRFYRILRNQLSK